MIEVEHLYKIYGPQPEKMLERVRGGADRETIAGQSRHVVALEDVSLRARDGQIYVIMGLSGSGKSTLVRCINRLYEPTAGRILVDGEDITLASAKRLRALRGRKIAMVFQHFALLPHRTVLSNAAFGLEVQGVDSRQRIARAREAIALVGLTPWQDHFPSQLSGGMQQRVGLARALAVAPDILLLDEPFSGLDPLTRKEMQRELLALQANLQKTIVFITHDLDEAFTVGDRVGILKEGRVVQEGTPQEIALNPADDYVYEFVKDVNWINVLTAEQAMSRVAEPVPVPAGGGADRLGLLDGPRVHRGALLREIVRAFSEDGADVLLVEDDNSEIVGSVTPADVVRVLAGAARNWKEA